MKKQFVLRTLCGLLALVLIVGALSMAKPAYGAATGRKVHPALVAAARKGPDLWVDVLVQIDPAAFSQAPVKALGGKFKKQWSVAPAVHLELPAGKVTALSAIPGVRWVTPNAGITSTSVDLPGLKTLYPQIVQAPALWAKNYTGTGIAVAVLDSGAGAHPDLHNVLSVGVGTFTDGVDRLGHGTHVAGIIAGVGASAGYVGVAPHARIISVKVLGDDGSGRLSDLLDGLEWVNQNRTAYNIRVVNLSLQSAVADSYFNHPVNAAVEALWLKGVVVVAAAGNKGGVTNAVARPPSNDPYVITVGALDDNQTAQLDDDRLAVFSGRGLTLDGHYKPEVVAPGRKIVSLLAPASSYVTTHSDRIIDRQYLQMSGTSLAVPVVSGVAALLLQAHPRLTPDQVKWLLINTARAYPLQLDSARLIDGAAAVTSAGGLLPVPKANVGLRPTGRSALTDAASTSQVFWDKVFWDEVFWDEEPLL